MAQQHIGPAIAVEVANAGDLPCEVRRQARRATAGEHRAAVHRIEVPAAVRLPQQHVVVAVAVEVADADYLPCEVRRQARRASAIDDGAAVHRVETPAPALVAQQHVGPVVAVEVADAGDLPCEVRRQADLAAAGEDGAAIHWVEVPASVLVAQEHIGLAVAVEVAKAAQMGWHGTGCATAGRGLQTEHVAAGVAPEGRHPHEVGTHAQRALDAEVQAAARVVVDGVYVAAEVVQRAHGVQAAAGLHGHFAAGGDLEPERVRVVRGVDGTGGLARQRHAGGRGKVVAVVVRAGRARVHFVYPGVVDRGSADFQFCVRRTALGRDRPAVQRERVRTDADAVRVVVRRLRDVAEVQAPSVAHNVSIFQVLDVARLPRGRADRQRQLRHAGCVHGPVEDHSHDDLVPSAVVAACRLGHDRCVSHRRHDLAAAAAIDLEACEVGEGVAAEAQCCVRGVAANPDRPAIQRQRTRTYAEAVRIDIGGLDDVLELELVASSRPPEEARLPRRGADRQRQLRLAAHLHHTVEDQRSNDHLAKLEGVAARRTFPKPQRIHNRRGLHAAVHLVASQVGEGVTAETQRCVGVAAMDSDCSAVQRQGACADADAVRVAVRRLHDISKIEARPADATGPPFQLRLAHGRADRQGQPCLVRGVDLTVEIDKDIDGLAQFVGVAVRRRWPNRHSYHRRRGLPAAVHLVACRIRDGVAAEVQRRVRRAANVPDRPAVQCQRVGADADAVRVAVRRLHTVEETELPQAVAVVVSAQLARGRPDGQCQLHPAVYDHRPVETHLDDDILGELERVAAQRTANCHAAHRRHHAATAQMQNVAAGAASVRRHPNVVGPCIQRALD